jgi:DNA-binding transcriptional LysR family regulator
MDTWGVLMRADDPLAQKEATVSSDFAHRPCFISAQQRSTEHETNPFRAWMGRKRGQFKTAGTLDLVRNAATMIATSGELSLSFESIGGYTGDGLVFRPLSPTLRTGSFAAWKRGRTFSDAARLFIDKLKEELETCEEPPKPHPATYADTSNPASAHERC